MTNNKLMNPQIIELNKPSPSHLSKLAIVSLILVVFSWFFGLEVFNDGYILDIRMLDVMMQNMFGSLAGLNLVYLAASTGLFGVVTAIVALHNIERRNLKGKLITEASLVSGALGIMIWISLIIFWFDFWHSRLPAAAVIAGLLIISITQLKALIAKIIMGIGTIIVAIILVLLLAVSVMGD